MFSKNKIFKNPYINTLCDRILYYTQKNNCNVILTGSVAKILQGSIKVRPVKDIDFIVYDDYSYNFLLRNLKKITNGKVKVSNDRIRVITECISIEFFDRRENRNFKIKPFRELKIQKFIK